MKPKIKAPKERNPVAAYAKRSGSGAHGKSKKAERRALKMDLKRLWNIAESV
jgi:hypothetical protein